MSIQITLIGLGQVGSSIGLALAEHKSIKRVGHDKDYEVGRRAQKNGAVDEFKINLPSSVQGANIVILSLPLSEIRETLKYIAQDLQEGTVILDTAPSKGLVAAWVNELVPQGRYYVGLTPAVGAGYLNGTEQGLNSARPDLFQKGVFLVNAPHGTPGEAVKLATDLVAMLGAHAILSDELEADGLNASAHILPQLISVVLVDTTVNQPGWTEARKVAARAYATATAAAYDEVKSLGEAALGNRESVLHLLDSFMLSLRQLRDSIDAKDDQAVLEFLQDAVNAHERWLNERITADWKDAYQDTSEIQSVGGKLSHMFLGNMMERTKRKK
jgi:prephenate dehydrogenase